MPWKLIQFLSAEHLRHKNWVIAGLLSRVAWQNILCRIPVEKLKWSKAVLKLCAIQMYINQRNQKITPVLIGWVLGFGWKAAGGREGKSKTSILLMMKPPYNALQDVKLLCVKFMSFWPPLGEMMGLFTAMPSVCC